MNKYQDALNKLKYRGERFGQDLYDTAKDEIDTLQELVDKYNTIQTVFFKNEPMESTDLNARKLQELYNFDSELIEANKKLKEAINILNRIYGFKLQDIKYSGFYELLIPDMTSDELSKEDYELLKEVLYE